MRWAALFDDLEAQAEALEHAERAAELQERTRAEVAALSLLDRLRSALDVPLRLRNAPTRLMKGLGYGDGYRYAHDEADAYAAGERYLPDEMPDKRYYRPVPRGLEIKSGEALERLRKRAK